MAESRGAQRTRAATRRPPKPKAKSAASPSVGRPRAELPLILVFLLAPLTHGAIQLQSEGAETFFRDIVIEPITALPRIVAP